MKNIVSKVYVETHLKLNEVTINAKKEVDIKPLKDLVYSGKFSERKAKSMIKSHYGKRSENIIILDHEEKSKLYEMDVIKFVEFCKLQSFQVKKETPIKSK